MFYLMQLGIILGVSFAAEILHAALPLPVPASVYGLCLMLALLLSGALKPSQLKPTSSYLIEVMPIMFVPSCVGLMEVFGQLVPVLVPFVLICLVSTVAVIGATGRVTQRIIRREGKKSDV